MTLPTGNPNCIGTLGTVDPFAWDQLILELKILFTYAFKQPT
jgi:hypothetical protein